MRPTGKLHLGNYVGALQNWVKLQDTHECFFFVADWHALTTDYDDTSRLADNTVEVVLDFLAAGLDPERCTIFVQSHVLQHAELHVLFSMITPLGWLERVPSYKEQQQQMPNKDLHMYGFLGYPLLQSADILIYRPRFVPVGEDQAAHVELTREVARRFNNFYPLGRKWTLEKEAVKLTEEEKKYFINKGLKVPYTGMVSMQIVDSHPKYGIEFVFPEPEVLLTPSPKLLGTDKRKMSKSYGNTILLSDEAGVVEEKIKNSVTDRPKLTDRGSPDRCPVGNLHQIFSDPERLKYITRGCTQASITCVECKALAVESVNAHLEPIRSRRRQLAEHPQRLRAIIQSGAQKAAKVTEETMVMAREAVGLLGIAEVRKVAAGEETGKALLKVPESAAKAATDQERQEILVDAWVEQVSNQHPLRKDRPRTFITRKARKVAVHTARQDATGTWKFSFPDRPVNVLVLLAEDPDGHVRDFVLPPKVLQATWKSFEHDDSTVRVSVRQDAEGPYIQLKERNLRIQQYQGDYSALQ
jgi:tryptophanyl-tRNA synthetase